MQNIRWRFNKHHARILLVMIAGWALAGCSATNELTMSVTEPAPVELPTGMKRIGILNRSGIAEQQKTLDKIDKILTVEGKTLDKDGAEQAVAGLTDRLRANDRFDIVLPVEMKQKDNPAFGIFPSPMNWDEVTAICNKNNLDGLFVLEFFDTDGNVNYAAREVSVKGPLGVEIPGLEHEATITTAIKTGWRIYDTKNKRIIDEYAINDVVTNHGKGINPAVALAAIQGRKEAVNHIGRNIGDSYAGYIQPYRVRVRRDYYVRGSDEFKVAKRKAQTGNWDGAAEHWDFETENADPKIAGRAYYNMAIINEINGNLDDAISWAGKAYEEHGNKLALDYLRVLRSRKAKQATLERQELAAK